ncbi:nuclear transport factor 2 family protein [Actinomadura sp. NBRC 104412]|uniref:nuclear transport factor 2 family protein n=1 Tax=Actinomadura sp. NBRC 104412 TaxID=3032203 RepID=UPI0025531C1B|nr:nuclear transport factor 2 family protein [Actinomadura sp. NBRC 104412]
MTPDPATVADRLALRDLVESYAAAVDARDADLLASLFTPGALLEVRRNDGTGSRYEGAAALPKLISALEANYQKTFHLVGNHRVTLDGDRAAGDTYCLAHHVFADDEGVPSTMEMLVRYLDRYIRDDGDWLIDRRTVTYLWTRVTPVDAAGLGR